MKKLLYIFFLIQISLLTIYAQIVTQEWVRTYNGPDNGQDIPKKLVVDNSGNVYVTGISFRTSPDIGHDIVTIKYNSAGTQQWVARFNEAYPAGGYEEEPYGIALDSMGFIYVIGSSGPVFGPRHAVMIKYNSNGDSVWVKRYYGYMGVGGGFSSIAIDRQNNIYVQTLRVTLKYKPNGDTIGVRVFIQSGYNDNGGSYIALDSLGNVFIGGRSTNYFPPEDDYLIYKFDSSGVFKWYKNYNVGYNDVLRDVAVDRLGNVYATGYTVFSSAYDYLTVKYNTNGSLQWARRYHLPSGSNEAYAVAIDLNNNVYVTGECGPVNVTNYGTVKYNSNGDSLWVKFYNGPGNGNDGANAIVTDDSGNVYVTGSSLGSGTSYDIATIKYNPQGIQQWLIRYMGPSGNTDDYARDIGIDCTGNVYVTGESDRGGLQWDFVTIKYSQLVSVKKIYSSLPFHYKLYQNYPNPFNPNTKIKFDIPLSRGVSEGRGVLVRLTIFDILGREIAVLVNNNLKPGFYEVEFNAWANGNSPLPSGVYFYRLNAGEYTETKKMVLLK